MRTIEEHNPLLADFMTQEEAAAELGIHVKTLQRWRVDNQGPPYTKLGRRILYQRSAVKQWIHTRERN
jgi:excisionase family DNA binding protein